MTLEDLKQYARLEEEGRQLLNQIKEIESKIYYAKPPKLDGMPHGGVVTDGTELIIKYLELQEKYKKKLDEIIGLQREVKEWCESLPLKERQAIRYKYVFGLSIRETAEILNYAERTVYRILKSAEERLKTEDELRDQ